MEENSHKRYDMAYRAAAGILNLLLLLTPGMTPLADAISQHPSTESTTTSTKADIKETYNKLPRLFIANKGRTDSSVCCTMLTSQGARYTLPEGL